jgi:Methylamine utilisation protein MauE
MEWAALVRATLALLLASAAVAKLARFQSFVEAFRNYEMVPRPLLRPTAALVVVVETVVAAALMAGVGVKSALVVGGLLLLAFAATVSRSLMRKSPIDCGCLGDVVSIKMDWASVAANVCFAAVALGAATRPVAGLPLPTDAPAVPHLALLIWPAGAALVSVYWLGLYARTVLAMVDERIREMAS